MPRKKAQKKEQSASIEVGGEESEHENFEEPKGEVEVVETKIEKTSEGLGITIILLCFLFITSFVGFIVVDTVTK